MEKANKEIRDLMYRYDLTMWMLAEKIGVHESTLIRWMRTEMPQEKKQEIISAITKER